MLDEAWVDIRVKILHVEQVDGRLGRLWLNLIRRLVLNQCPIRVVAIWLELGQYRLALVLEHAQGFVDR